MSDEKQVLVRFVTKLPADLCVPSTEVAVPSSLKRYGLSQIINHLLDLEPSRPFDFIIDGELVRRTLEQHLLQHNISPESIVEVEYVPAVIPPQPKAALPQDDWVTAVAAVCHNDCLASGSADGIIRLWDDAGKCLTECSGHKGGINAVAAVPTAATAANALLVTAGKDHKLRLWDLGTASHKQQQQQASGVSHKDKSSSRGRSVHCIAEYQGHQEAVQAVAVNPTGSLCCSSGWDGQLMLWKTGQELADIATTAAADTAANGQHGDDAAGGNRKKRKVASANGSTAIAAAPVAQEPVGLLPGHLHCVAAVTWPQAGTVYSGGWDHSVRRYDVETRKNTDTYNGSKVVSAVAAPADGGSSSSIVAFGGSDRVLRIWDCRGISGEGLALKAYTAHEGWISALAWRPGSSCQLVTGGLDGAVKLWDIRTAVPLGSLNQHKEESKVLCVGWWGPQTLVSGGSDCQIQLYSMS